MTVCGVWSCAVSSVVGRPTQDDDKLAVPPRLNSRKMHPKKVRILRSNQGNAKRTFPFSLQSPAVGHPALVGQGLAAGWRSEVPGDWAQTPSGLYPARDGSALQVSSSAASCEAHPLRAPERSVGGSFLALTICQARCFREECRGAD
jgi:hypothetical protein